MVPPLLDGLELTSVCRRHLRMLKFTFKVNFFNVHAIFLFIELGEI